MEAFDELFQTKAIKVMKSLQPMEIITMIGLFYELTQKESGHYAINLTKVGMDQVQDRTSSILKNTLKWQNNLQTGLFREIVKRLHAFGLIKME